MIEACPDGVPGAVSSVSGEGIEGAGRGTQAPGKRATRNSVMKVMVLLFTSPSLLN
jgi:hypothetical protein